MLTQIVLADVTTLRYRAFAGAVLSMPFVINTWISAEITEGVLGGGGWRWGYGMFAILVPVCLAPVIGSLLWAQTKAKKLNMLQLTSDPNKNLFKHPLKAMALANKEMDVSTLLN
jgi:MFS family permease